MAEDRPGPGPGAATARHALLGRQTECAALEGLLADGLAGRGRVLILRGEAGIGKSALLDHLSGHLGGWRVARGHGVDSEMEFAHSGLHQICAPMLDLLERLPAPQREALSTVFGLSAASPPDRFLVGLAVLTLFAEVSERQPLAVLIDDAQWLDHASEQVLAFVARRLLAERVVIVCAARAGIGDSILAGLPELAVRGIGESDARALLRGAMRGPLDDAVFDRIIAESRGNPLALLELPRSGELAGGFALPDTQPVAEKIEQGYVRRLAAYPSETRLLVLTAAAEPLGDPVLLQRAIATLGIDLAAVDPAVDAGLMTIGARVEFAHPLVRSAVYIAATDDDRRRVHQALAEATDVSTDPDRRAWHRARAIDAPDEEVARELEQSAGRARARGGLAAAAAFLRRAADLSPDASRRAERALAAAEANFQAGAFDAVRGLLDAAERETVSGLQRAQARLLRGHLAVASAYGNEAARLLLEAARALESFDIPLARRAYLTAWGAAVTANHLGGTEVLVEICRAVRALPPLPERPHPLDLLIDGLALLTTDGPAEATPILRRAAEAVAQLSIDDILRWGWIAPGASSATWDSEGALAFNERKVHAVRQAGALGELPIHLHALALERAWSGDFAAAALLVAESDSVAGAAGTDFPPFATLRLYALQGREAEASSLIARVLQHGAREGQGIAVMMAYWAGAVLNNGLGRYQEAASAAREVVDSAIDPWTILGALPELVEASIRLGETGRGRAALDRLTATTQPAGTDFALGIEARSRALLSRGEKAHALYRESIERFGRTGRRPEWARAHLLYGEHLRREGHRVDAREHLRTAHTMFTTMGMDAFAERARRELLSTGEKVPKRAAEIRGELTAQEAQIAQLARDRYSNPEIGARLFLSPRTVEWHLRHVYAKLGISSRSQLRAALPREPQPPSS